MNESKYDVGCIVEVLLLGKYEHVMLCVNPFNSKLAGVSLHDGKIGTGEFENVAEFEEMMQAFDITNVYKDLTELVSDTLFTILEDGE